MERVPLSPSDIATFKQVVADLRARGEPADWAERDAGEPSVCVPSGPVARW